MDTNRDSVHQSQNEHDFPTFSLGLEFLKEAEREKTNGKGRLGIIAVTIRSRGGYSQKNWVEVCGPLLRTLTLFMNKICDIPYPIYDVTKNSKPYL